jgi:shikimate dehydrogenase
MVKPHTVGLIGNPVAQSLSPAFQQAAFDACGLSLRYELWQTDAERLVDRLQLIRDGLALGANVTVPHKEAVTLFMDDLSPIARRIGAVNTIVRDGAALVGHNTDAHGFIAPLLERSFVFESSDAIVLGAGGASRAVVVGLLDSGIQSVAIVNRTPERADRLARELGDSRVHAIAWNALEGIVASALLIVNATALGWADEVSPVPQAVLETARKGAIAYDLTYRDTAFLQAARHGGLAVIDGLPMLVHQGARSFELWTGLSAPVDLMWDAAVRARAAKGD